MTLVTQLLRLGTPRIQCIDTLSQKLAPGGCDGRSLCTLSSSQTNQAASFGVGIHQHLGPSITFLVRGNP